MEEKQGDNLNSFQINIHGLCGFKPLNTQVWTKFIRAFRSEIFLLNFLVKNFDRSEDQLYQIWAFYDLLFLR